MNKSDFSFELPDELIARYPAAVRSDARLLVLPAGEAVRDAQFRDLPSLLAPEDLLVFNDSRVLRARFYASKPTGGRVEVLLERIQSPTRATARLGANRKVYLPTVLTAGDTQVHIRERDGEYFVLELEGGDNWNELLAAVGEVPLPPYLRRAPEAADEDRYQTVYARAEAAEAADGADGIGGIAGSVAAPTAGLHFDEPLLAKLKEQGVPMAMLTLHIGGGTFQPLRSESLDDNKLHAERIVITSDLCDAVEACRARGGRVAAVGTTVLRALESAADASGRLQPCNGETDIFIRPGFRFRVADVLVTNFHLPETSLFVLVCAFAGLERMQAAYRHAIERGYRFFSYGDAMCLERFGECFGE